MNTKEFLSKANAAIEAANLENTNDKKKMRDLAYNVVLKEFADENDLEFHRVEGGCMFTITTHSASMLTNSEYSTKPEAYFFDTVFTFTLSISKQFDRLAYEELEKEAAAKGTTVTSMVVNVKYRFLQCRCLMPEMTLVDKKIHFNPDNLKKSRNVHVKNGKQQTVDWDQISSVLVFIELTQFRARCMTECVLDYLDQFTEGEQEMILNYRSLTSKDFIQWCYDNLM